MFPNTSNQLIERMEEILQFRQRLDMVWRGELSSSTWNKELENLPPLPIQARPFFHHEQAGIHILPEGNLHASILLKHKQVEEDYSVYDEFKLPRKRYFYRVGKEKLEKKHLNPEATYDLYYIGQKKGNKRNESLARGKGKDILVLLQTKLNFYILGVYRLEEVKKEKSYGYYLKRVI